MAACNTQKESGHLLTDSGMDSNYENDEAHGSPELRCDGRNRSRNNRIAWRPVTKGPSAAATSSLS